MKSKRAVLDVLFPAVRARLVRLLFTAPVRPHYVRELMNLSALSLHTVQDELRKLSAIGLLKTWSNGYKRFYQADAGHAYSSLLLRMVALSDELPAIQHSTLCRPRGRPKLREKKKPKRAHLPPDRPIKWHRLSKP
jgi:predicted transcriptional regulator